MQRRASALVLLALAASCAAPLPPPPAVGSSKQTRPSSLSTCTSARQCEVIPESCCGRCGAARRGDARAVNAETLAHRGRSECADTGCPACHEVQRGLAATCRRNRCAVVDVERTGMSRCSADSECVLRAAECCGCGRGNVVAIRADAREAFERVICGDGEACAPCETPSALSARCQRGRCRVVDEGLLGL